MSFSSVSYILFLSITLCIYYASRNLRVQKLVLIGSSILFIGWFNIPSAVVVLLMAAGNYYILRLIGLADEKRKRYYLGGLVLNITVLLGYKVLQDLVSREHISFFTGFDNSRWILLGIGFYTLQIIGYYIEVYRNPSAFRFTPVDFFIAILFFAKLPSGPIIQLHESALIPQQNRISFSEQNFAAGFQRLLLGIFKKVALADRLSLYVHDRFDAQSYLTGFEIYLAPILFTLQLYFDFSGYIDMAIGTARLFGIRLPENFDLPLRATSIGEFWRRWHITLVSWLKRYVYFPVSFRYRKWKTSGNVIAILITFIVSATWHGIAITFFLWAACHFIYLVIEAKIRLRPRGSRVMRFLSMIWVLNLVAFSHLFFRAHDFQDLKLMVNGLIDLPFFIPEGLDFKTWLINGGRDIEYETNYRIAILLSVLYLLFEKWFNSKAGANKYSVTYAAFLLVLIIVLGMFNSGQRFIYFQF